MPGSEIHADYFSLRHFSYPLYSKNLTSSLLEAFFLLSSFIPLKFHLCQKYFTLFKNDNRTSPSEIYLLILFSLSIFLYLYGESTIQWKAWGFNAKPGFMHALACFQLVRWPWASDLTWLRKLKPCREITAVLLSVQSCCDWFILNKAYLLCFQVLFLRDGLHRQVGNAETNSPPQILGCKNLK